MTEYHLAFADAATRVSEVIDAILSSKEWGQYRQKLSGLNFVNAREPFRRFFDAYEEADGMEWLGIMENMVIEEMRLQGAGFNADPLTIESILARIERHPNVCLER